MAAIAFTVAPNPNCNRRLNGFLASCQTPLSYPFSSKSSLFMDGGKCFNKSWSTQINRCGSVLNPVTASLSHSFDVVVIGAGIIGLSIARQFLLGSDLSVAVVDAAVPCSGATGAGQGYLWMVHRTPWSDKWELAVRSRKLWEMLAEDIQLQGMNPLELLGWKKTGSLLIGRSTKESETLKRRVEQLSEAGLRAEFLSSSDLQLVEPALLVGPEGGAAFVPDDCQLDAHRTVAFIEEGHLLVLENFNSFRLNHGLMEASYVGHKAATLHSPFSASEESEPINAQTSSVSMTATMDSSGNLVLGSSRQLVGFSMDVEESIINRIWDRAGEFFPTLRAVSLRDFSESREVRIGLRPYMPDGKPVIGPVFGLSNVFLAAGHEGEGLSLALGTAEMVVDMVMGNPGKVDYAPFALQGRCW